MEPTLYVGSNLDVLPSLRANSVDSIVTDPPYELSFMNRQWDATGIAYSVEMWAECLRVLKPGGLLLSFGGTRTFHRMQVAIEDAGFEVLDTVHWLYGCLTDDAEILTNNGWVRGVDISEGDVVAQWDSTTNAISLTTVLEKFQAPWRGDMTVLRNSDTEQVLTPNHRVYFKDLIHRSENSVAFHEWSDWVVREAGEVPRRRQIQLPLAGFHDGEGIGGTDYAALLGWVWTEGSFDKNGTGVRIYQSSVKQEYCDEIAALMDRSSEHKRYDRDRNYKRRNGEQHRYTESTWFFTGDVAKSVRRDLPEKSPTFELLFRMTLQEKEAFLDAALKGDGSQAGNGSWTFEQKSVRDREWMVTLLALVGRRGHNYARKSRDGGSVSITQSAVTNMSRKALTDEKVFYEGDVWCVRVETGAFVARRNGKVFITGNSGFPKSLNIGKALDKAKSGRAAEWEGWGTALKPSHEPIVVARKPVGGRALKGLPVDFEAANTRGTVLYFPKANKKERPVVNGVSHATVKPLALMRYLVSIATPDGGVVLDPFAGSGTTLEAAVLEGRGAVGVELTVEHVPLIEARMGRHEGVVLDVRR